ncbi:helix-turn-helix domain-containing protein [Nocardiopsis sp. Huas11]|uniref:helix-turn-helix domain-containing protein n=1 Tax=Nocardiopsis sp. Huas11 TaxID=2183912 RepID=UPI000EAEA23D|nr:helix-turn-helix domain-containing protein [Nocardiopsis sp. Huas11]
MAQTDRPDGKAAAILALARGSGTKTAAQEAGVSPRTVRRWLADDTVFADEVRDLRGELLDEVVGALTSASMKAVETLVECLQADDPSVRVRAAAQILRALPAMRVEGELTERFAEIEAAVNAQKNGARR